MGIIVGNQRIERNLESLTLQAGDHGVREGVGTYDKIRFQPLDDLLSLRVEYTVRREPRQTV